MHLEEGNIDHYQNALEKNFRASVDKLSFGRRWIFEQYNDAKCKTHIINE